MCDFYEGDLSRCDLEAELKILGTLFAEKAGNYRPTISLLKTVLQSLTSTQRARHFSCFYLCLLQTAHLKDHLVHLEE